MKTLNSILKKPDYKARDHSKDAKRFADKHVIKRTDDANGNDDKLFNASNIKAISRKKDRHGYEPGEDAGVYESVRESIAAYLDESDQYITEEDLEELTEEILDELSKKTLRSYISGAKEDEKYNKDATQFSRAALKNSMSRPATTKGKRYEKELRSDIRKGNIISKKRIKGIDTAIKKLTREDVVDSLIHRLDPDNQITNEEKLLIKLENYSDSHKEILLNLMDNLTEENQYSLIESLNSDESVNEVIDFAIRNNIQEISAYARKKGYDTNKEYGRVRDNNGSHIDFPTGKYYADKSDGEALKKFGYYLDSKLISHGHSNERKAKRDINRHMKGKSPRGKTR